LSTSIPLALFTVDDQVCLNGSLQYNIKVVQTSCE